MSRTDARAPIDLRTDRAHPARIYDVFLGGRTNYSADRAMAATVTEKMPSARLAARSNREFVLRAVRYLAGEAGIRQFLDIGTGIPTSPNLHEVAQATAPESRVVYTDNDPIVLAHSRALHVSNPAGRTTYIQADFTDPETILASAELRDTLDLGQPVALTMGLLLHWIAPKDQPHAVVRRLMDALPVGSWLLISVFARELAGVPPLCRTTSRLRARPSGPSPETKRCGSSKAQSWLIQVWSRPTTGGPRRTPRRSAARVQGPPPPRPPSGRDSE